MSLPDDRNTPGLGHGQVAEFITVEDGGDLTCRCGNDASNEGFGLSTATGVVIDPDDDNGDWDGIHYRCARCGRIVDQRTGRVVGTMTPARRNFIAELQVRNMAVALANEQHGTYSDECRLALARWTHARKALERITRAERAR